MKMFSPVMAALLVVAAAVALVLAVPVVSDLTPAGQALRVPPSFSFP